MRGAKVEEVFVRLTLRWVPGHEDVEGNDTADGAAKEAAGGLSSPPALLPKELRKTLPLSASRARQNFKQELERRARELWRTSRRGVRMAEIDGGLPSQKYEKLITPLSRRHANLLMQLRTGHIPLNTYLERIGKSLARTCPACGEAPETVKHFLVDCPDFSLHRAVHLHPLGHSGRTLSTLLNTEDALQPLFAFINATGRLRSSFGKIPDLADGG